jgi:hypothetical protein
LLAVRHQLALPRKRQRQAWKHWWVTSDRPHPVTRREEV